MEAYPHFNIGYCTVRGNPLRTPGPGLQERGREAAASLGK